MEPITIIIALLTLVSGAGFGFFLRTRRAVAASPVEQELRQQRSAQDSELSRLREELTKTTALHAAVDAERQTLQRTLESSRSELDQLAQNRSLLTARVAELEAEGRFLKERLSTERAQLESLQEKIRADFEAVSHKLLIDNVTRFNQQSSENLGTLLAPLKETLGQFSTSLESTRKETATHSALLQAEITRIGKEASNLSKALKGDVKVLGNWGENILDQLLERSGLTLDLHYRRQSSAQGAGGEQRFLDVIIDLPEGRNLIIDSKVSLKNYEEAVNSTDEALRTERMERHIESIRSHFKGLGNKRYQDTHEVNTPDFVLMYIPVEPALLTALAEQPSLFSEALDYNVVLTTNSTLLATLRTVAHVWRSADQQKHALEIAERGGKLYDKFVGFVEDLQQIGKALRQGQDAYTAATNKLVEGPGNLVRQAAQIKTLGAKAAKSLPSELVKQAEEGEQSRATHQALGVQHPVNS